MKKTTLFIIFAVMALSGSVFGQPAQTSTNDTTAITDSAPPAVPTIVHESGDVTAPEPPPPVQPPEPVLVSTAVGAQPKVELTEEELKELIQKKVEEKLAKIEGQEEEEDAEGNEERLTIRADGGGRISYGEPITIAKGETAEEDVVSFGGPINVAGIVYGSVVSFGGPVAISGNVQKDVVSIGGNIHLQNTAQVFGEVVSIGGAIQKDEGATVAGNVQEVSNKLLGGLIHLIGPHRWAKLQKHAITEQEEFVEETEELDGSGFHLFPAFSLILKTLWLLGFIGIGLIVALLFPTQVETVSMRMKVDILRSFAYGLLGYIVLIIVGVILAATCIGIPIAFVLVIFFLLMIVFGMTATFHMLGSAALALLNKEKRNILLAILIGALILSFLLMIPLFIGPLIWFGFSIIAVGTTIITRFGTNKPWFGNSTRPLMIENTNPGQTQQ